MIGGFDEYDYDSKTTTELIDQFASISGPDLPWGFSRHCATKITEFTAIIIGGSEKRNEKQKTSLKVFRLKAAILTLRTGSPWVRPGSF